jgi:uncharacterized membrane protein YhaH (DUF805 family)
VKAGIATTDIMVWRDGLPEWISWKDSGIQEEAAQVAQASPSVPVALQPAGTNPYLLSERNKNTLGTELTYTGPGYTGYGRLRYFLTIMLMTIVSYAVAFAVLFVILSNTKSSGSGSMLVSGLVMVILMCVFGFASLYIGVQRVRNLGMSGWAILWTFVPIMNLWIGWRMMACPEGYEDHRTLDTAAKVITGVWIGFLVLAVVSSAFSS